MLTVIMCMLKSVVCVGLGFGFSHLPEKYTSTLTKAASVIHYVVGGCFALLTIGYIFLELFA